jgi:hypothetical protein
MDEPRSHADETAAPKTALRAGCYRRIKRLGTSESGVGGPSAAWS